MKSDFAASSRGMLSAARQVAADLIDAGRTRLELAALEVEEERLRVARLMIHAAVALFLLFSGVALATTWAALMVDAAWRPALVGGLSLTFLVAAALAGWRWRQARISKPSLLQATLLELSRDANALCTTAARDE